MKNTDKVLPIEDVKPTSRPRKKKVVIDEPIVENIKAPVQELVVEPKVDTIDKTNKVSLKQWLAAIMVIMFCFQQAQITLLTTQVNNLSSLLSGVAPLILKNMELSDMQYYKENSLTNIKSPLDLWNLEDNEYFVYFGREDCSYCKEAEKNYVIPFIQNKYTDNVDIYFYTMSDGDFLYATDEQYANGFVLNPTPESFYILGTPTLLHIKDGIATTYIGLNEIPKALNPFQN